MLMLGVSRLFHSHYFSPLSLPPCTLHKFIPSFSFFHTLHHSHSFSLHQGFFVVYVLLWLFLNPSIMTRGNQRERDRERAQARAGGKSKQPKSDGLTPEQRRERDAKALQEKAARKAAQSAGGNNAGGGGGKNRN